MSNKYLTFDDRLVIQTETSQAREEKERAVLCVDRKCHIGRSYEEYELYLQANPDAAVCQMDSVIVHPGGQAILTVFFTNCDLQLM